MNNRKISTYNYKLYQKVETLFLKCQINSKNTNVECWNQNNVVGDLQLWVVLISLQGAFSLSIYTFFLLVRISTCLLVVTKTIQLKHWICSKSECISSGNLNHNNICCFSPWCLFHGCNCMISKFLAPAWF